MELHRHDQPVAKGELFSTVKDKQRKETKKKKKEMKVLSSFTLRIISTQILNFNKGNNFSFNLHILLTGISISLPTSHPHWSFLQR